MQRKQQPLFSEPSGEWEDDDKTDRLVATVVFPTGAAGEFDYLVPEELRDQIADGQMVCVPLGRGNRAVEGYCVRVENRTTTGRKLKQLTKIVDTRSLLSPAMINLTGWIAEKYLASRGQTLEAVVPAGVRGKAGTRKTRLLSVPSEVAARIDALKLPPKQAAVIRHLSRQPRPLSAPVLARAVGCTQSPIDALCRKGLIQATFERVRTAAHDPSPVKREPNLTLNDAQQSALTSIVEALSAPRHETLLLLGVTGSGKTEVYIQAIQEVVRFRRQAIVLVPEISLTPQTVDRFRSRFDCVAVLHSHLTDSQRHQYWEQIASGEVQVVVGARSAIFAPTPNLGLVVIDEEHESSFKQESAPRYHARSVALERTRSEGIPLVLGSATPSLESYLRACEGEYRLLKLPHRVFNRPMPSVGTIDLRAPSHGGPSRGAISRTLERAMREALGADGQVILLLNRRGFATHIQCPACGLSVRCPNCDLALVHHRAKEIALCHYCDYQIPTPSQCPECRFAGIRYAGRGTQRLEAEVRARFPNHRCLRMDTDSMQKPGSHAKALDAFRAGEVRILLGTQMIAKGLDFPNVTLVGVISADTAIHLPDFRAAERTFQLLAQVAGRTGRGDKGGRVLVQTLSPDHAAVRCAVKHDYEAFARQELPHRKAFGYPPFTSMIRVIVRAEVMERAAHFTDHFAKTVREAIESGGVEARVLGPTPAPFARLRDKYRFHFQIQGPDGEALRQAVREAAESLLPPDDVEWIIDVDPYSML